MPHVETVIGRSSLQRMAALLNEIPAEPDAPGYTSKELEGVWKLSKKTTLQKMAALILAGKLVQTGTRQATSADGRRFRVKVYDAPKVVSPQTTRRTGTSR
jgi:hypothetical protein